MIASQNMGPKFPLRFIDTLYALRILIENEFYDS